MRPFTEKKYPVYDVAEDDLGKQPFVAADPKPYAVIARAVVARYPDIRIPYTCISVTEDACIPNVLKQTRDAKIKMGVYAYMLQGKMERQVDVFISYMKRCGIIVGGKWQLELPPAADIEIEANLSVKGSAKSAQGYVPPLASGAWASQCKYWLDAVESAAGIKPMIYTAKYILDTLGNPLWLKDYLFWMKYYPFTNYIDKIAEFPISQTPKNVSPDKVILWQYFDGGRSNGFNYNDMNTMTPSGVALFGGSEVTPVDVPPDDDTIPVEVHFVGKYKVITSVLNIRPDPSTSHTPIGKLFSNDIVDGIETTPDKTWVRISRKDGLIGWCSAAYLQKIEDCVSTEPEVTEPPTPTLENSEVLFGGAVIYRRITVPSPRPQIAPKDVTYHVMQIDVDEIEEIVFDKNVAVASTTHFLENKKCDIAINGDGFYPMKVGRKFVTVMAGFNAAKGSSYGAKPGVEETLYISKDKHFSITSQKPLYDAISFPNMLIRDGKFDNIDNDINDIRARTAVGYTKNQKTLFLVTVDGKDYWLKEGLNFQDTGQLMFDLGCWTAIMLDGGGSTTMVINRNGKASIVNVPSGENADHQRSVANHFGVRIKTKK